MAKGKKRGMSQLREACTFTLPPLFILIQVLIRLNDTLIVEGDLLSVITHSDANYFWKCFHRHISSVQLFSHVWLFVTLWTVARQASLSITNSQSLLKLMSIELVTPSNHLILCRSLLLLPSIPPSIRVFSNESTLRTRWPKYWSFSFSISPSNEHPGLISFRMDCLDLHAVQGTLKSLLQHHSSKTSILWRSAFFIVQLSHPYTDTSRNNILTPGAEFKEDNFSVDWKMGGMVWG